MTVHYDGFLKNEIYPVIINFKKTDLINIEDLENKFSEKEGEESKKEDLYICKFCEKIITTRADHTEINGDFIHLFKNPAGIYYRIGLFIKAPGCTIFGDSTTEFTWFPGFVWNYAICSNCFSHLGWYYQSGENSFFGLILDHLIEENR